MCFVKVPAAVLVPPRKGGNPDLFEMQTEVANNGIPRGRMKIDGTEYWWCGPLTDFSDTGFTIAELLSVLAVPGVIVEKYKAALKITNKDALVPDGIPWRMTQGDSQSEPPVEPRVRTWDEWAIATGRGCVQYNGSWYVYTDRTRGDLTGAQMVIANNQSGVELVPADEFKALDQAANSPGV